VDETLLWKILKHQTRTDVSQKILRAVTSFKNNTNEGSMIMKRNLLAVLIPALLATGASNAAEVYNKEGKKNGTVWQSFRRALPV
jgi:hypothetical protein